MRYFPFAPGIPWKLASNQFIVPQIDKQVWDSVLRDKDLIVMAYGGLLESFWSLSIIEMLAKIEPNKRLFWAGNEPFQTLVRSQGLAKNTNTPNLSENYPVPLFLDRQNKAYFNCLNNYLIAKSYDGRRKYTIKKYIAFEQLFRNSLVPWKNEYTPQLRRESDKYLTWAKSVKFKENSRFILIIPEQTPYSNHSSSYLDWNSHQLRELSALVRHYNIPVIVCSSNSGFYYDSPIIYAPLDLDIVVALIRRAWVIMANQIDYLLISLSLSKANIISLPTTHPFDLFKHAEIFNSENGIFTTNDLTPMEVYTICGAIK